jgi:hypothetical protein
MREGLLSQIFKFHPFTTPTIKFPENRRFNWSAIYKNGRWNLSSPPRLTRTNAKSSTPKFLKLTFVLYLSQTPLYQLLHSTLFTHK